MAKVLELPDPPKKKGLFSWLTNTPPSASTLDLPPKPSIQNNKPNMFIKAKKFSFKKPSLSIPIPPAENIIEHPVRKIHAVEDKFLALKLKEKQVNNQLHLLKERSHSNEELVRKRSLLLNTIENLQQSKSVLERELHEKHAKLSLLSYELARKVQISRQKSSATEIINSRLRETDALKNKLKAREQLLEQNRVKLETRSREIDFKEREILHKHLESLVQQSAFKGQISLLKSTKDALAVDVRRWQVSLEQLRSEWETKAQSLSNVRNELLTHKNRVEQIVKSDLSLLSEKEDEVLDLVKKIEQDNKNQNLQEHNITLKQKSLERNIAALDKKNKAVDEREKEALRKDAFLRKSIQQLQKVKGSIERQKTKVSKVKDLRATVAKLQQFEREIEDKLSGNASVLIKKEKAVHAKEVLSRIDVESLVEQVRGYIASGELREAKQVISQIEQAHYLMVQSPEKKQLGYTIDELKTSLKLALLV